MKPLCCCIVLAFVVTAAAFAAPPTTTPQLGIRDNTPTLTAFTGARIVASPTQVFDSAVLIVENGVVVACGPSISVPASARVIDLAGLTVYPGFIDPCSDYGIPETRSDPGSRFRGPQYYADRIGGSAWNESIHSEKNWIDFFRPDSTRADTYLRSGFTTVQTASLDGVFRGRSAVVTLRNGLPNDQILRARSHHFASFSKGNSPQDYPSSLMGSIALIRQMYLDLEWYRGAQAAWEQNPAQPMPECNTAIEALGVSPADTLVFFTDSEQDILRANRIAREFNKTFIMVGSGFEYRRIAEIARLGCPVVLPLEFPETPTVKSIEDELDVTLSDLRHWERAPSNPAVLEQHKVPFALTTTGAKKGDFLENLRTAVKHGLSPRAALQALTTTPAKLCGVERFVGTLEPGKLASFSVWSGDLFSDTAKILAAWVVGERHDFAELRAVDFTGTYRFTAGPDTAVLSLSGRARELSGEIVQNADTITLANFETDRNRIAFTADSVFATDGIHRFSGRLTGNTLTGRAALPEGGMYEWSAVLLDKEPPAADSSTPKQPPAPTYLSRLTYPDRPWGLDSIPTSQDILIQNATIWTCDSAGVLENADMLVQNGRIAAVGRNLRAPSGISVLDASGKHVTPGIIDEHSHTAISGDVNEGTHAITSEVRIEDILDPDDINIYRQLAGGVTAARLLHGSANPVGGQAAAVKWRWGLPADSLIFRAAPRAIKFALGENVKQSGWGERFSIRYPQTRLGVDAILRDAFTAARQYEADWKAFRTLPKDVQRRTVPPRRDLQLEALVDVLQNRMAVHCHAYVAPEMLAFIRLSQEFGFKVQSFAHGLEGYKIARELVDAGVGVGSIADWWAFKFETYDGIAQSPALMMEKGVIVDINSDSPELARRLPQEAAKSVMYGQISPEDALKMETINAARLMGVDGEVGSLTLGKDADFVIWDGNPLSLYSRVEQTWIEGRPFFDRTRDSVMREELRTEKQSLIQKVLAYKESTKRRHGPPGPPDRPGSPPDQENSDTNGGRHEAR